MQTRPPAPLIRIASALALPLLLLAPPQARAQQTSAVPVTIGHASRQDVPIWLTGLGTVQAYYAVQIHPRVDGTLTQIPVHEGQDVKKGDLLAVIDPRPYQSALDLATAKKQQDQAQLGNAQADFARYASLARQDFASHQQLDTQNAMVKQFSAAILGDQAQVEAAQLNLSFCYITAPFDARVGLRNVDPGNMIHSADASSIFSVIQIQPISVTFTLPQDTLPQIMQAMAERPLEVVVSTGDQGTELDRGTLLTPDNSIDPSTGTIKLKATFANQHKTLWPGQFVTARLNLGTDHNVMAVAAGAVQHGPNGLYVYQVKADSTVAMQPVDVARQEGDVAVIANGLADGTKVVLTGQSRLQTGARIVTQEAAAKPPQPAKSGG